MLSLILIISANWNFYVNAQLYVVFILCKNVPQKCSKVYTLHQSISIFIITIPVYMKFNLKTAERLQNIRYPKPTLNVYLYVYLCTKHICAKIHIVDGTWKNRKNILFNFLQEKMCCCHAAMCFVGLPLSNQFKVFFLHQSIFNVYLFFFVFFFCFQQRKLGEISIILLNI